MMLIGAASMLLVFGMPYLMDNSASPLLCVSPRLLTLPVDPELKAEFVEQQKKSRDLGRRRAESVAELRRGGVAGWVE